MSQPDLTLIVVAHRSAEVLPACLESVRREAAMLQVSLEVIVVEQSESPLEAERIHLMGPDLLITAPNRGYAAGLNRGLASASGETVLLANPDIAFQAGSLAALLAALDQGWHIVGPQLELAGVLFPPAEEQSLRAEWGRQRARRKDSRNRRYLQRHFEQGSRVWNADGTQSVANLSGCLLACRRFVAESLGPWDEDYFLYFEETDWLVRAGERGLRIGQVPTARVIHGWGHSANPVAQEVRFQSSRRRFYRRRYGPLGAWLTERPAPQPPCPTVWPVTATQQTSSATWLVSASPFAFPAGRLPDGAPPFDSLAAFEKLSPGALDFLVWGVEKESGRILGPYVRTATSPDPRDC